MKTYLIIAVCFLCAIFAAYWAGGRVSIQKCRAENSELQNQMTINLQSEILKIKGEINAETFNIGVLDIRYRLREKYTMRD